MSEKSEKSKKSEKPKKIKKSENLIPNIIIFHESKPISSLSSKSYTPIPEYIPTLINRNRNITSISPLSEFSELKSIKRTGNRKNVFDNKNNPFSTQNTKETGERFKSEMAEKKMLRLIFKMEIEEILRRKLKKIEENIKIKEIEEKLKIIATTPIIKNKPNKTEENPNKTQVKTRRARRLGRLGILETKSKGGKKTKKHMKKYRNIPI